MKNLKLKVVESETKCGIKDVKDIYFDITLVVDKDNNIHVFDNNSEDDDYREIVDWNTLVIEHIKLRP